MTKIIHIENKIRNALQKPQFYEDSQKKKKKYI